MIEESTAELVERAESPEAKEAVGQMGEKAKKAAEGKDPVTAKDVLDPKGYRDPKTQKLIAQLEKEIARLEAMGDPMATKTYSDIHRGKKVSRKRLEIANERVLERFGAEYTGQLEHWFNTQAAAGTFDSPVLMRRLFPEEAAAADAVLGNIERMERVEIEKGRLQLMRDQLAWQKHLKAQQEKLLEEKTALEQRLGISMEVFKQIGPGAMDILQEMVNKKFKPDKVQEYFASIPMLTLAEKSYEMFNSATGIELTEVEKELGILQNMLNWVTRSQPATQYEATFQGGAPPPQQTQSVESTKVRSAEAYLSGGVQ
jgi:hypothetical protein